MVPVTPEEMAQAVRRAGLSLNPGQLADLVLAWQQLATLSARIPRDRPLVDDMTVVFRLPPPAMPAPPPQPVGKTAKKAAKPVPAKVARKKKAPVPRKPLPPAKAKKKARR